MMCAKLTLWATVLGWTEEVLECEANDKPRQALLECLSLSDESMAVNGAAVKPKEIEHKEDVKKLDEAGTRNSGTKRPH